MSCCEKLKYDRLKVFIHASVLACQEANITGVKMAVVKKTHHKYGAHYEGIPYDKAKELGLKVILSYSKGDRIKTSPKYAVDLG